MNEFSGSFLHFNTPKAEDNNFQDRKLRTDFTVPSGGCYVSIHSSQKKTVECRIELCLQVSCLQ